MIQLEQIRIFFPAQIRNNPLFEKYMLKEYLQLSIMDYLSSKVYIRKLAFIGGTYLRLVKGIDRFSEDLDFDCKGLTQEEFIEMTDGVLQFLERSGWRVEPRGKESDKINAFRRSIYFPELLFDLKLSGHKDERFLIKIEGQDQGVDYQIILETINGCGFFFPFPVPRVDTVCSMKIAAMLARSKGRDFYDLMFLLSQTRPDYNFLSARCGIHNLQELKKATHALLNNIDLKKKQKDFDRLLFNKIHSDRILLFGEFMDSLTE